MTDTAVRDVIARAAQARQAGRPAEARALLDPLAAAEPANPVALNALALLLIAEGDARGAVPLLRRAAAADPSAPPIWINLAHASRAAGDDAGELAALDRALAIDPYLLPALLNKAQAHERLGQRGDATRAYRALLAASPDDAALPPPISAALAHGRALIKAEDDARIEAVAAPVAAARAAHEGADLARADAYLEQLAGRRKVYQQQPTGGHFPFLPALEFFDRSHFPWFEALEAATPAIRSELEALWHDGEESDDFVPYVAFDPTVPVNQWAELNHSPRWSAFFLWRDGEPQRENLARCPATARALDAAPLLDIGGRAPTAMFSLLKPRTRIPPHTGTTNVRTTVHLPLVVPDGCGFRVGAETREWRIGEAWAFDDTIEHEAWNDSGRPRAILILDCWNPLLTQAERAVVRAAG